MDIMKVTHTMVLLYWNITGCQGSSIWTWREKPLCVTFPEAPEEALSLPVPAVHENQLQVNPLKSATLRYFEKGHTFMAADSFHKDVEGTKRQMKRFTTLTTQQEGLEEEWTTPKTYQVAGREDLWKNDVFCCRWSFRWNKYQDEVPWLGEEYNMPY